MIFKSSTSRVAVFKVVVLPCTVKSPPITTLPVLPLAKWVLTRVFKLPVTAWLLESPIKILPSFRLGTAFVLKAPWIIIWFELTTLPIFWSNSPSPVGIVVVNCPVELTYKSAPKA